ncbi:MAG TPA: N-acetyltransferase [Nitrolancea sp.]|jgi:putative acetyltransferase|nr:N-acetyltransferase [Nitrolancea sp.]
MGSDLTIREERPGEEASISEVNRRAFGRHAEAALVESIRVSNQFIPELSLVAEQDGEIVGHILFSPVTIRTASGDVPALTLAPVAVLPEFQNRRIGSSLIEHGLIRARELGHDLVLLIGHPRYYPRFGFKPAGPLGIDYPKPIREEVFMVYELVPGAITRAQGTLVYPPAFDGV